MNESVNLLVPLQELTAYILKCRSKLEEILELIIYSFSIFICLNALLYHLIHRYRNGNCKFRLLRPTKLPHNASRVLLVTAHPDDEAFFFGPTLITLKKRKNCTIFVLCLSQGNLSLTTLAKILFKHTRYLQVTSISKVIYVRMSYGTRVEFSTLNRKISH